MTYHAFMSYSHAGDRALATALQSALHRFARPWNRLRALQVFRDQTNLAVNPKLWPSIQAALDQSEYFVYLASPDAAASPWVERELAHWLDHRGGDRILIVLTAGGLRWDDATGGIDRARTDALPRSVMDSFSQEPLYLDLRWARNARDLSLRNPRFRDAVADLAATLHGRPKDELIGEDVRQHRRMKRLRTSAVAALGTLTLAASIAAGLAIRQRNIAEEQREATAEQARIALSRQLAAQSVSLTASPEGLTLALLLALESTGRFDSADGNDALRRALAMFPHTLHAFPAEDPNRDRVRALAFSPDGRYLAAARDNGAADVYDLVEGRPVAELRHDVDPGVVADAPDGGFAWKAAGVDEEVTSVAFGGEGRMVATGSNDGSARVWDLSGRQLFLAPHDSSVSSVALDASGTLLASGSSDGTLRVWRIETREELVRLTHGAEVRDVAFSPDDRYVGAVDVDGGITLVDLATGRRHLRWYAGTAGLDLAFDPGGSRLATASAEAAFVWDVVTGKELLSVTHRGTRSVGLDYLTGWIDDVAFSPDGGALATAGRDGTARVWSLATGQELVRVRHGAPVESVEFSPDGTRLVTSSWDGTARLWDVADGREQLRAVHEGGSEVSAFGPDGSLVASSGVDGSIRVWEIGAGDQVGRIMHDDEVRVVAFAPAGSDDPTRGPVFATVDARRRIRTWSFGIAGTAEDPNGEGAETPFGPGAAPAPVQPPVYLPAPRADRLVFSEDGSHVAARWSRDRVFLLGPPWPDTAARFAPFDGIAEVHPRYVVGWDRPERMLRSWSTAGGRELAHAAVDDVRELALDATGAVLATVERTDPYGNGVLHLRSLPSFRPLPFTISVAAARDFAVAPAGRLVAVETHEPDPSGYGHRTYADVWDPTSGARVTRISLGQGAHSIRFDPSGDLLLTLAGSGGDQGALLAWDAVGGELRSRLEHRESVTGIRFGPEAHVVATVSGGDVQVWDAWAGALLSRIDDAGYVRDVRFSPDGRYLLTGAADGAATLWPWRTEDLRREACRRLDRNLSEGEWRRYLGSLPYRQTCPGLPEHPR